MNRIHHDNDAWEIEYDCSYRSLSTQKPCRELSGREKKNRTARYSQRPTRQSSTTQGIHRRGKRHQAA